MVRGSRQHQRGPKSYSVPASKNVVVYSYSYSSTLDLPKDHLVRGSSRLNTKLTAHWMNYFIYKVWESRKLHLQGLDELLVRVRITSTRGTSATVLYSTVSYKKNRTVRLVLHLWFNIYISYNTISRSRRFAMLWVLLFRYSYEYCTGSPGTVLYTAVPFR